MSGVASSRKKKKSKKAAKVKEEPPQKKRAIKEEGIPDGETNDAPETGNDTPIDDKAAPGDNAPSTEIFYRPLTSATATRWRAAEPVEGVHQLAGCWKMYAKYDFIPMCEYSYPEQFNGYLFNFELLEPITGTLELKPPSNVKPRDMTRRSQDSSKETAQNAVPLLEGTLEIDSVRYGWDTLGPYRGMPVTVVAPGSFESRQRVVLGGIAPAEEGRERLDGAAVWDATVHAKDAFEDDSVEGCARAASVEVHGGPPFSLGRIDMAQMPLIGRDLDEYDDEHDEAQKKYVERLDKDDESLLLASEPPLTIQKGDLRLMVRWLQRGGHGWAGIGMAFLLRRTGDPPPEVKDPSPVLRTTRASPKKRFEWHQNNINADCF